MGEKPKTDDAPEAEPAPVTTPPAPDGADAQAQYTAALAAAQAQFPKIAKTQTAHVQGKPGKASYSYSYADLADVLAAVRPVLAANGLTITQPTTYIEGKLHLITKLRHVGGGGEESIIDLSSASPGNPQAFGGSLTYLRRYELTTLLGIAAEDDTDAQHVTPAGRREEPELPAWSLEAEPERKTDLVDNLEAFIPRDKAKELLVACKDTWGYVPDVVVAFAKALTAYSGKAADVEAIKQARLQAAKDKAAQAGAGEEPQTSPPVDGQDPDYRQEPLDEGPPPVDDVRPPEPDPPMIPGTGDTPAFYEKWPSADKYLEDGVKAGAFGNPPDLSIESAGGALKAAGCTCPTPMGDQRNDGCPFADHGIPF